MKGEMPLVSVIIPFTLRLSQNHNICFLEEPLVKVYDSPNSVDKRFADQIRTQAHIVREMIGPLREYGILWDKLAAMQETLEHLKYHDVFLEELQKLEELFVTEQDKRILLYWQRKQSRAMPSRIN